MAETGKPSQANLDKMWAYARKYAEKSGTFLHPDVGVTETVVEGLARHIELVGRPLCPCNFYPEGKKAQLEKSREWNCACDEMKKWNYCHCLLFATPQGLPVTVGKSTKPCRGKALRSAEERTRTSTPCTGTSS